ncbi:MAG: hypothetical protein H8E46_00145 [FCB group bacterium]|nr:hypothetical protein [FCB group bacterium]
MRRRENFIWGFLIAVAIIIIFASGFKTYTISKEVREFQHEEAQDVLGTDQQLLDTVNKLESQLKERLDYVFAADKDPLKLSEVIRSPKLLAAMGYGESFEGEENMRLNLTVIGRNPYASIKYMGKFYNLQIGDSIGGYRVADIDYKQVVLKKAGQAVTLYNRPDPETVAEQRKLEGADYDDGNF